MNSSDFPYEHLSPSSINKYLECPLKFLYYKEGRDAQWDQRYAMTGKAVHAYIQQIYGKPFDEDLELDLVIPERYQESIKGWEQIIRTNDLVPGEGMQAEETLTYELDGVTILGRIDLLSLGVETVRIYDWKTGQENDHDILQARIYQWLGCHCFDKDPALVSVHLCYLRGNPPAVKRIPYTSHSAIEGMLKSKVIDPIRDMRYDARKTKGCGRCEYRHLCEAY